MTYACITTVAILVKLFCVDSLVTSFVASHFCRILFPFMSGGDSNISNIGLCRVEGRTDPDDYLDIESGEPASISPTLSPFLNPFSLLCFFRAGYGILHPLVFIRLFPTLINLYVLHHEEEDLRYLRGLKFLQDMDVDRLTRFIKFPRCVWCVHCVRW